MSKPEKYLVLTRRDIIAMYNRVLGRTESTVTMEVSFEDVKWPLKNTLGSFNLLMKLKPTNILTGPEMATRCKR